MLTPKGQLTELKLMIEHLEVHARVCFDHAANYWRNSRGGLLFSHSYEGYAFPEKKPYVLGLIEDLNNDPAVHGILVQLPLPDHLDEQLITQSIRPEKDVDGFHFQNIGMLTAGIILALMVLPYMVARAAAAAA